MLSSGVAGGDRSAAVPTGGPLKTRTRSQFLAHFRSYRFVGLLLAMMALLIGSAFLEDDLASRVALAVLLSLLLFATVMAASTAPHLRWIAAALATISGIAVFAGLWLEHRAIYLPAVALLTIYLAYTIGVGLRRIVMATEIDADILCGAVAIYFLVGIVWAMSYWLIHDLNGGAFAASATIAARPDELHLYHFLYYSFSTLTSLGIGDITPVNRFAQIWTTLETVTGNLYIAVLVARLVSLYR